MFPAPALVLDGGLGSLLESHGHDLASRLWSARLLLEHPEVVREAHAEYFRAGARVAITGSYQVSYDELAAEGLDRDAVDVLLARSVELAVAARADASLDAPSRDAAPTPDMAWVAASVGPYGASLADGSEYTGDYGLSVDELRAWHRPRLRALAAAGPDLLAVETIPSLAEVESIVAELSGLRAAGLGVPAWVSVTIASGTLRSGESLAAAFELAAASDEVVAIGVNCCDPREVTDAIRIARAVTAKPVVVYPNSGGVWDADARAWVGTPGLPDALVARWLDAGATLVGGCCRVGPAQITSMAGVVAAR